MKRSLLRLIEYSLLPAILLILAKIGGIYFAALLFNIEISTMAGAQNTLFFDTLVPPSEITVISSYSDLFMYLVIALGMTVVLVQALYLHDSHVTPKTINLLAKNNLLGIIRSSFDLYHSGVMWLVFLWVANILILINTSKGLSDLWTLLVATVFSISYSIIFLKDLFTEIELNKHANANKKS